MRATILLLFLFLLAGCAKSTEISTMPMALPPYDVVIRGGTLYDGTGAPGQKNDLAIKDDRIVKIGLIPARMGKKVIDARGKAVSPGFINMLSWATESLLIDGRAMSDIKQGVTLEIFGEGWSMGPLNPAMKAEMKREQTDLKFDIPWTSLGEYLEFLEKRGVAPNVASFVGAATVRMHELGSENRAPTAVELARMEELVRQSMREGALGVGSSLIYAPGFYAKTDELIALAKASAPFRGRYISHMRSEADQLLEGIDELITIGKSAGVPAEIYHLKMGGKNNWKKINPAIKKIQAAQKAGIDVTANMYNYTAGSTGLNAAMPPWVQEGGYLAWQARLKDPVIRARVLREMRGKPDGWENLYRAAGSAKNLLFVQFGNPALKYLTGKTLDDVAKMRKTTPEDTMIDLVIEDGTRVGTTYFLMSEPNVRRLIKLPWMAFGSDGEAAATEGDFLKSSTHPRAYGNVARLLGTYVRDQRLITLPEAIHRLSGMTAKRLGLRERGLLEPGYYADVVIFDPEKVKDMATYDKPHQYSVGVSDVFVNGVAVLSDNEPTGLAAGRFVRGPGWTGWSQTLKK